ncbi:MAG: hypothetical protein F4X64_17215 [Chloroflexi bacterium]|nr:hypothetical protein [Chloroflexota bacterium]
MSEAKIVFRLGDVVRVRCRCQTCGNEVVFILHGKRRPTITKYCPLCNAEWLTEKGAAHIDQLLKDFDGLDTHKVDVLIEIDAPAR